jgi:pimeloyl-ACP methyl ester carboxylesterase
MPPQKVTVDDGAELAVQVEGNGAAVLLVSGLGGSAAFWESWIPGLAKQFTLIRFDQRGIGASTRGVATCTVDRLARDALSILDALCIDRPLVIGHSTGGCIAQSMAALAPHRIGALVLSGTWLRPNEYMRQLFGLRIRQLWRSPEDYAAETVFLGYPPVWLNRNWGILLRAVEGAPTSKHAQAIVAERISALLAFDGSAFVSSIRMPTLVVGASDDVVVPSFLQDDLAHSIPQGKLHLLPDGGHFFPITRMSRVSLLVSEWYSRVLSTV